MYRRTYVSTPVLTHVRSCTCTCIRTPIISPYTVESRFFGKDGPEYTQHTVHRQIISYITTLLQHLQNCHFVADSTAAGLSK